MLHRPHLLMFTPFDPPICVIMVNRKWWLMPVNMHLHLLNKSLPLSVIIIINYCLLKLNFATHAMSKMNSQKVANFA